MKGSRFALFSLAGGLAGAAPCHATNHEIQLDELMAGCGGDPRIQFVEVVFPPTQNHWGGCAELAFFDASGAQTASFPFPSNVPDDHRDDNSALIATQAFADLPGAPRPDFIIPPVIQAPGGKVCFSGNQPEPCFPVDICLSYGAFRGDTEGAGPPAPTLPVVGPLSLQRFRDSGFGFGDGTQFNADFALASPIPRNNQGAAGIVSETPGGCRVDPACAASDPGSPCADDGDPCTQDRCTDAGSCAHEPCNVCSACDPILGCVPAPAIGCVQAPRGGASLVLTDSRHDRRDRLVWNWKSSTAADKLDFGAPLRTTDYEVCVYEMGTAPALKLEATAPAGGLCAGVPCWKETSAGFQYKDKALTPDGIAAIGLTASATPRKSTIRVKGKGPRLGLPPSFASPLTVQLRKSDEAECWEATYSRIVRSGETLKAKAD